MKRRLIAFDLDGTLVDGTVFIWRSIYEEYIPHIDHRKMVNLFHENKISYSEWFFRDLENFKRAGITKEKIVRLISGLSIMSGALDVISALRSNGFIIAVISGGIDIVPEILFPEGIFDELLINKIVFDTSGHISTGIPTPFDMQNKALGLQFLADKYEISMEDTFFVGDNENDIEIAKQAAYSIAFNSESKELVKVCDVEVKGRDLRYILEYIPV